VGRGAPLNAPFDIAKNRAMRQRDAPWRHCIPPACAAQRYQKNDITKETRRQVEVAAYACRYTYVYIYIYIYIYIYVYLLDALMK